MTVEDLLKHRSTFDLIQTYLMLVTEPHPALPWVVGEAVSGGVNMVMLRRKTVVLGVEEQDRQVRAASVGRALLVLNAPDVGTKVAVESDGFHHSESAVSSPMKLFAPSKSHLIGRSVHSVSSAMRAEQEGFHYLIAGTIFRSTSHPDVEPQGLGFLNEVCSAVRIPVIAIGGITPENAPDCIAAGAAGVAVLSPIMRAADPRAVAARYAEALGINTRSAMGAEAQG